MRVNQAANDVKIPNDVAGCELPAGLTCSKTIGRCHYRFEDLRYQAENLDILGPVNLSVLYG